MTLARDKAAPANILIGAGELYIVELDADDEIIGERYLGDSISGSISAEIEGVTVYSGDGAIGVKLVDSTERITRNFSFTLQDINAETLRLLIMGETATQIDAAVAVTDEVHKGFHDAWRKLGIDPVNKPAGVRAVSTSGFVVTSSDGGTTYAAGTDYELDANEARFRALSGGSITDGETLKVDYTPTAGSFDIIKSGENKQVRAGLRYIEQPVTGKGHDYYAPLCMLRPAGESTFKAEGRQTRQTIQIAGNVLQPASGPDLVIVAR